LGLAGYIDAGISDNRFPPFIAIMPDNGKIGNYTSGGTKSVEGIIVDNLIPFVDDNYCSWSSAEGRSIGGISRGGYWALEIAFRQPNLFVTVSGHSSHLRLETDPARYNPLSTYESSDLSDIRIWLDRGDNDFLWEGQDLLHTLLTEAGVLHHYQVSPGGHSDSYWAEHLPQYIDWHASFWPTERAQYPQCQ
jgi:enterochelin esterase-like enzyme